MNAKPLERYRLREATRAPPPRNVARSHRHAAITGELGTYAKYQDWARKARGSWPRKP